MPIQATHFPKHQLIYARYSGAVTRADITNAMVPIYKSTLYTPGSKELIDLQEVTDIQMDFSTMRAHVHSVARAHSKKGPVTKMSFIRGSDVTLGMLRMFQTLTSSLGANVTVYIAPNLNTALAYLDLDAARFVPLLTQAPPHAHVSSA